MAVDKSALRIVIAEDDEDDRIITKAALQEAHLANPIDFVCDGEELMEYLHRAADGEEDSGARFPGLILLDLNMPRKDGREALAEIKSDPQLRKIPIVVLTTSKTEEDILRSYDLGVNSFIAKPVDFEGLRAVMKSLKEYWFEIVKLPNSNG
jgi:CheY-like chemotaxis protein